MLFRTWSRAGGVTFLFATFLSGLIWLETFRTYQSEVSLLVIPKENAAGFGADQVVENIAELPRNLSFYERILLDNDEIEDRFAGMAPDQRKARWNDILSVSRRDASGILVIGVRADTPETSRRLTTQTVKTLLGVAAFYYTVEKELRLRIVDGPITGAGISNIGWFAATTLATGAAITGLLLGLLSLLGRRPRQTPARAMPSRVGRMSDGPPAFPPASRSVGASVPYIDPKKFLPEKPTTLSFETAQVDAEGTDQVSRTSSTRAAAPPNLPVLETETIPVVGETRGRTTEETEETEPTESSQAFLAEGEMLSRAEDVAAAVEEEASTGETTDAVSREPTIEEYKRRLNELLEGRG